MVLVIKDQAELLLLRLKGIRPIAFNGIQNVDELANNALTEVFRVLRLNCHRRGRDLWRYIDEIRVQIIEIFRTYGLEELLKDDYYAALNDALNYLLSCSSLGPFNSKKANELRAVLKDRWEAWKDGYIVLGDYENKLYLLKRL